MTETITKLTEEEFTTRLMIRQFVINEDSKEYGMLVFPVEIAYNAYLVQYKKEHNRESEDVFFELMKSYKISKRQCCTICELFESINKNSSNILNELLVFENITSPELIFQYISPFNNI
jgi:hypothetical protein